MWPKCETKSDVLYFKQLMHNKKTKYILSQFYENVLSRDGIMRPYREIILADHFTMK